MNKKCTFYSYAHKVKHSICVKNDLTITCGVIHSLRSMDNKNNSNAMRYKSKAFKIIPLNITVYKFIQLVILNKEVISYIWHIAKKVKKSAINQQRSFLHVRYKIKHIDQALNKMFCKSSR